MKAFLSILLGLMLLTSLVGISYATPVMQPAQNTGGDNNSCTQLTPNNPNYYSLGCAGAAHQGGNENPPSHGCAAPGARIGPDFACCGTGQQADTTCCGDGITPHSFEVSDIQPDGNICGPP